MTTISSHPAYRHLHEPSGTTSIRAYAKKLWGMRHYARAEARGGLETGHAENVLGRLWLFIEPVLFIGIYFLMFGVILDASRGLTGFDFLSYLAVGKIVYGFMRRAIQGAAGSLIDDQALGAVNSMPRAVYPLAQLFKAEIAYRYEVAVMLAFVLLRGTNFRMTWLLVPVLALMAFAFCFGAGLILVRMISSFADLRNALPQVFMLGLYLSGVIFPVEQYVIGADNEVLLLRVMAATPFYAFVKLNQWAVMGYTAPQFSWIVGSAILWAAILPFVGFLWFIRSERRYSTAIYGA